jgi:hypothetical protein
MLHTIEERLMGKLSLLALMVFALPAAAAPFPHQNSLISQYQSDVAAIKAARTESNRAIAAHDLASFLPMFADDAVFTWSNGSL